ncbi:MAG: hypothetical protein QMC67_05165 [Candidatus Wallbacteria bacterium]
MDINEAKKLLSSNDIANTKQAIEYLKNDNDISCVESLKAAKTLLPINETSLIEEIDNLINEITKKALSSTAEGANTVSPGASESAQSEPAQQEVNAVSSVSESQPAAPSTNNAQDNGPAALNLDKTTDSPNGLNSEFPKNEYLDKVKVMWEKGKDAAIKNATILRLKSQLNTIKNDKLIQIKHLGEKTYETFSAAEAPVEFIKDQINKIKDIEANLAKCEAEEKELENARAEGSMWNVFKAKVAKVLGYTKIKLDISILKSNREGKVSSFGQLLYDKLTECESVLKQSPEITEILATIENLEKQRQEKEVEINEISSQQ